MSVLELPPQLRGSWEHALIMTYGLDVAFFERTLLPLFSSECRNKIVLVDGTHFLEICARSARSEGQLLHFNQTYLASGIFAPRAAHAKIILLANKEQGRLLVGSGNTSWQGYASGGELFTMYEYRKEIPEALPAFLAMRELIEQLAKRHYVQGLVEQRLAHFWANAPWLWQRGQMDTPPVRHTLNTSFLVQIKQSIGEEVVEELWVLAPFFDERAAALAGLIEAVRPARTVLLLQSDYVSVDRVALQQVLDGIPGHCEIHPLRAKDGPLYLHAKLYVFKMADRALCVQGSPNMSQVAMLLHDPQGNIETANFLVGPRDAFDDLLAELPLTIGPAQTNLSGLELRYQKKEPVEEGKKQSWQLLGGEWQHDRLWLHTHGTAPDLRDALLVINGQLFPLHLWNINGQTLELALPGSAKELLTRPTTVSIRWSDDAETYETNPIIPCDKTTLDRILQQEEQGRERLDRSADLNLDDQAFEELLGELHDTLVIDQDSIWKVAARATSTQKEAALDDKGLHLGYDEIDYEALRSHPKIRQYLERGSGAYATAQTRIGMILHAISRYMQGLLQQGGVVTPPIANAVIPSSDESEDEPFIEDEPGHEEDEPARRWSVRARIRRTLSQFIQRYLRNLALPSFQQLVGYQVVAKNYLIFSHLLWRLFAKDWLEYHVIINAFIQSWHLFWGDQAMPGYFYQLSVEEQLEIWEWMRNYFNDALTLAAYYYGATIAIKEQKEDLHFSLRESWRNLMSLSPFPLTADVLEEAQKLIASLLPYRPPMAAEIVNELTQLAHFETQRHFIATLVAAGRLPGGSCSFRKEPVWREPLRQKVSVDCLVIDSSAALSTKEAALTLVQAWMQAERLDYYRIASKEPNAVHEYTYLIFYDRKEQRGKYSVRGEDNRLHVQDIPQIHLPVRPWEAGLQHLWEIAQQLTDVGHLAAKDKKPR
jgi:hypothetical protein